LKLEIISLGFFNIDGLKCPQKIICSSQKRLIYKKNCINPDSDISCFKILLFNNFNGGAKLCEKYSQE